MTDRIKADIRGDWVVLKADRMVPGVCILAGGCLFLTVSFFAHGQRLDRWDYYLGAIVLGAVTWLLAYRRTIIADPTARQISLYERRRLVRNIGFGEVTEVGRGMRREARGRGGRQVAVHFVRLLSPGGDLELLAQDDEEALAREVAEAIADATGKPLREL